MIIFYLFSKKAFSKNFKISYKGFIKNMKLNIFRKKVFQNSPSSEEKKILENALEIIYEFGRHFWRKRDFRAIFWDFRITKSDKSKNVSGYGLYEYIGEEKSVKKFFRKNGMWTSGEIADFWPNFNFAANFRPLSHNKKR